MAEKKDDAGRPTARYAEAEVPVGNGGETHQEAGGDSPVMITQQSIPVADDQNSLRYGARGPTLLGDFHFREKIFHFDHERIDAAAGQGGGPRHPRRRLRPPQGRRGRHGIHREVPELRFWDRAMAEP
jgi:hypothetical protein